MDKLINNEKIMLIIFDKIFYEKKNDKFYLEKIWIYDFILLIIFNILLRIKILLGFKIFIKNFIKNLYFIRILDFY